MNQLTARLRLSGFLVTGLLFSLVATGLVADDRSSFKKLALPFLKAYCIDCHGPDAEEGGVVLHQLDGVTPENAELWKRIWEQVALKEMPPADENSPPPLSRLRFSNWTTGQIEKAMRDLGGFQAHLLPGKGNHLDHDLLFGKLPDDLKPVSTPARIWRIAPQEQLVRLNALINTEPLYDPDRPGLRARGDRINPNEDGEIKVYYGLDRVIGWVGGTAAYAAAITGFPPILSTSDHAGLRNYPILHSVNGAEATQISSHAEDILRFMAFGPDAEPYQFADKVADIDNKYKHEGLRGLAQSLFYGKQIKRPITPLYHLMNEKGVSEKHLRDSVTFLFEALTCRAPTEQETRDYLALARQTIRDLGKEEGAILGLVPLFLDREALFRTELADYGQPDSHGRVMLEGNELMLAINSAFSYLPPDSDLKKALADGKLKTGKDVERELKRILNDPSIRKPRLLQFFREYFDYDRAASICKDSKAMASAGANTRNYYRTLVAMTAQTDRLVELILEEDRNVLQELLTTDRVVVNPGADANYFGEFTGRPPRKPNSEKEDTGTQKKKKKNQGSPLVTPVKFPKGKTVNVRIAQVVKRGNPRRTLTTLPTDQRMGILTHPSWLVSHSDAMDNHAIHRGKWIRERLLGGGVPDVPITVDAMLPDEPNQTLRHRMRVTREDTCWRCHQKMDPLGLPFEMYNHVGIYRRQELKKPVDSAGEIINSGDATLDGPVSNALEMIEKLAASERVHQVFVRHAFRFWIGRNETLEDAPALQAAYRAYRESGGSMKALLTSLLTSDAFLYRTVRRKTVDQP
ncbi:MAG: DUF1588 domain-containing protein [Planctomycetota bacterium]|nr:DUF1588 domain-containing protein [Planctomycetota bacterium]